MRPESSKRYEFGRTRFLRWVYVGRMTLAPGILVGMMVAWFFAPPETTRIATLLLIITMAVILASVWHTDLCGNPDGKNFLYSQIILEV